MKKNTQWKFPSREIEMGREGKERKISPPYVHMHVRARE